MVIILVAIPLFVDVVVLTVCSDTGTDHWFTLYSHSDSHIHTYTHTEREREREREGHILCRVHVLRFAHLVLFFFTVLGSRFLLNAFVAVS